MQTVVKKFGGTSVGDVGRIKQVADLLVQYRSAHPEERLVVVVSAMVGETNRLLRLVRSSAERPSARESDMVAATGEQVTIALMALALCERGLAAQSLTGAQAGIRTNADFSRAEIEEIQPGRINELLAAGVTPVIAGFQGVSASGEITTLGRGGSDITAVAVAAALHARACYIYTDVQGVYQADPRICRKAEVVRRLSHGEMLEAASLGTKVLHPRAVYFAMRYNVPLVTLSTFEQGAGTWIVAEEEFMEKPVVSTIAHRLEEALLTIQGIPISGDGIYKVFQALTSAAVPVDVITQSGSRTGRVDVTVSIPDEVSTRALECVQGLIPMLGAEGAALDRDIAKISVVGAGMRYHTDVAARLFGALARAGVQIRGFSSAEIKLSVLVPRKFAEIGVRALHQEFFEQERNGEELHAGGSAAPPHLAAPAGVVRA